MCGVIRAFCADHSGWSCGSGSGSTTSRAHCRRPERTSLVRAAVSTTGAAAHVHHQGTVGQGSQDFFADQVMGVVVQGQHGDQDVVRRGEGAPVRPAPWTSPCASVRAVLPTRVTVTSKGSRRRAISCPIPPTPTSRTLRSARDWRRSGLQMPILLVLDGLVDAAQLGQDQAHGQLCGGRCMDA